MTTDHRTVGSPVPTEEGDIESDALVNRPGTLAPNELINPDVAPEDIDTDCEKYNSMRVDATFMAGGFIADRAGTGYNDQYHCPAGVTIVKSNRYVILNDLQHGLLLPITEDRFKELIKSGVLTVTDD